MRQVSPGRQRASVEDSARAGRLSLSKDDRPGGRNSDGHGSDGHGSSGHGSGGSRTYPAVVLWIVLVVGVLLGLLFAGVISSFVGGSSDSRTPGSGRTSVPSAIASQQSEKAQSRQRSDSVGAAASPESRDVRIYDCGTDAQGYASARVLITNGSTKRSTYYVRVLFVSAGNGRIISDAVASVKRLPPGQVAPLQDVNAVDSAPGEKVDCTLGSVSRF